MNSPGKWHTPADGLHMFPEMVCFLFEDFLTGPPNKNGYFMVEVRIGIVFRLRLG